MSYALFTVDDFMGLLPFLSIVGFLLYGIGRCLLGCFHICRVGNNKTAQSQKEDNNACLSLSCAIKSNRSSNFHAQSIIFLLFLSYLLSPLSTLFHLNGKRWNKQLYHRSRTTTSTINSSNNNGTLASSFGLYDLIHGTDPQLDTLMAHMPSLLRGPRPPVLFANRHLQFLPWLLQNEWHRIHDAIPYQRMELPVTACLDKSHGTAHCQHPNNRPPLMTDTITLDVFPPFQDKEDNDNHYPKFHAGSPILFIAPGLRCNSQDLPGTMLVRRAFGAGFRTVVVHRRGHTINQPLQAPRWNLFGDVDDLEQVYWFIQDHYAAPHTPFFLHGISSGTSVVVSALAEWDARRQQQQSYEDNNLHHNHTTTQRAPSFVGSVSITPGYDISRVMLPNRFKIPYNPILTQSVKDHFIKQNEQVLRQYNSAAVDQALAATNLQDLLNAVAPFAGYPNASAYYKGENPVNNVQAITTPKLILNSIDDPCCNVHNIYEQSPYPRHEGKTYAQIVAESQRGLLAVTATGSHCPFLDTSPSFLESSLLSADKSMPFSSLPILNRFMPGMVRDPITGGWMLDSWADRVSIEYYQAALLVYGEERRHMR